MMADVARRGVVGDGVAGPSATRLSEGRFMDSLKGQLLIATPQLLAPFFARTVILMLEHGASGALGVVLNRPTEATVSDIAPQALQEPFEWPKPIYLGGPVPGPLMVLHTLEEMAEREVLPGLYSCVEAAKIQQVIRQRVEPSLIIANYSGWGPGQLEGEIEADSWFSAPATVEHVFWDRDDDLWTIVVKEIRNAQLADLLDLDDVPPDPTVN
jgi:putative transcriptional regulator